MIWSIVSDSSCDLRVSDFASEKVLFETVPLRLQVGAREFIDNDELDTRELLTAMDAEKTASSTACPSPAAFARAFEKADRTVCFTISANLSGSWGSACAAKDMVLEAQPDKKITIINSIISASMVSTRCILIYSS